MERFREYSFLGLLFLLLILISLLGLAPRSHQASLAMEKAQQAASSNSYQEAALQTANAARLMPWRTELWELAGHYALLGNDPQGAIRYLEQATLPLHAAVGESIPQTSLSSQGWIDLGDAYQNTGDLEAALLAWQQAISITGSSVEGTQRLLQVHRSQGDYPSVIADLQTLTRLQPKDGNLRFQLGLLIATQQPLAALDVLTQAANLDPNLARTTQKIRGDILAASLTNDPAYILLMAGRSLAGLEEWELAAEAFRQATLARPDYAEAWAYLGEALQHLPAPSGSSAQNSTLPGDGLAQLNQAIGLDPKSLSAHTFLALYWLRQGYYDRAQGAISDAILLDPNNPVLKAELGGILAAAGDLQAALEAYQEAITLAPNDPLYLRHLANFSLTYEYQVEKIALPAARQAVLLAPQDVESLDIIAQVLIRLNDLANAERFLQRALQADPDFAPAHLHMGLLYILLGDREAGFQELNRVFSLSPDSPTADQARRLMETYFP